jgi:hypothetical protein
MDGFVLRRASGSVVRLPGGDRFVVGPSTRPASSSRSGKSPLIESRQRDRLGIKDATRHVVLRRTSAARLTLSATPTSSGLLMVRGVSCAARRPVQTQADASRHHAGQPNRAASRDDLPALWVANLGRRGRGEVKSGISRGKATGALLTGGVSLLATVPSRKQDRTQAHETFSWGGTEGWVAARRRCDVAVACDVLDADGVVPGGRPAEAAVPAPVELHPLAIAVATSARVTHPHPHATVRTTLRHPR